MVPRLGSACLNEGIAPWAAAKGHPWPTAQYLRSAIVVNGASEINVHREAA
nr:nucleoid-structuring protein H-NS [Pseudomonas brassicacearum]